MRAAALAAALALGACATGSSQQAASRSGMTDDDRAVRNGAGAGMLAVSLIGLGASTVELGYGHRQLATGTLIGTLAIDAILGLIVVWENRKDVAPCSDRAYPSGGPTFLPPCGR